MRAPVWGLESRDLNMGSGVLGAGSRVRVVGLESGVWAEVCSVRSGRWARGSGVHDLS